MCESEVHGLPGSGGSPSVERLNAPSPDREEPTESPRDSLVTKESEAAQQDPETPAGDALETPGASEDDSKLDQVSTGSRDSAGVTPASSKESIVKKNSDDEEGIDPFSVKTSDTIDALLPGKPADRRGSKTVNFKDPEVEETPIQNGKETVTSSPSSTLSRSSKDGSDLLEEEGTSEKQLNKHRALGEGNPVYRLSMKLSPNLFNMTDIPGASQHREAEKAGYLTKLSGRSFPYIPQWKRRYCVLAKGRLYYYEREDSKAGEKTNGVINLEYFDHVAEAGPKDCKKATNVFIITSQDRSFFDPGRHLFSADTLPDMKDWIRRLHSALEQIRNNNRPATSTTSSSTKESGKRRKEENQDNKEKGQNKENLHGSTKEKKKKKTEESHRSRKPGVSSETQTPMGEVTPMKSEEEAELKTMTSPRGGVQLPGLMSYKGFQLPGMSAKKEPEAKKEPQPPAELTKSTEGSEDLPQAGPILPCVTKLRVKGPQGRRAPQSQRRITAAALKKRASSLSALEYQDINDNSDAPWLNRSLDVLDDGVDGGTGATAGKEGRPARPYKAYNYSSDDEEHDDDGDNSHSDSFPTSASGMPPPPLPPRSASYGLELRQNPAMGLAGRQVLHSSLGDARGSQGDLGGSKRSLGDGRMYGLVGEWHGSPGEEWGGSRCSLRLNGDVAGRASPAMDDLENMLMNQSIQHTSAIMDSTSDVGSEGSTCRAAEHPRPQYRKQQQQQQHPQQQQGRKKSHDLSRFGTAVRHLQRHVVEVDRAVFNITSDIADTRREVTTLKEAVLALQVDTDTITSTLSNLTQEAITAQEKITFAAKEAEKVQHAANLALREAERARQEQLKSKKEYEELVAEVRAVLKSIKDSHVTTADPQTQSKAHSQPQMKTHASSSSVSGGTSAASRSTKALDQGHKTQGTSTGKSSQEHKSLKTAEKGVGQDYSVTYSPKGGRANSYSITSAVNLKTSSGSSPSSPSTTVAGTKSSTTTQAANTPKTTGYQSLFAKPSSIISGLTNRHSLTKSVSFADQKDKEKDKAKAEGTDAKTSSLENKKKKEKHQSSQERKEKKDDKHQTTLERKDKKDSKQHKDDKKHSSADTSNTEKKKKEKNESLERKDTSSIDRRERRAKYEGKKSSPWEVKDSGHLISQISLEDIPMADDNSHELLDRSSVSRAEAATAVTQKSSIDNTMKPSLNFSLGKSSSSPTVSYVPPMSRPRALPLSNDRQRSEHSISNASSPESPITPSPFPRPSSALPTLEESPTNFEAELVSLLHRAGSTPGPLARQGSMTTVPEDSVIVGPPPSKRPGVFAISRQNSSPNISLQRQNSGPIFPLQRQHSLGIVPEESRLPRQESLMSVPEERPIVDQTLPLSPSQSMTHFPLSHALSSPTVSESTRRAARESMELVTGPVLAGSSMQEAAATGTLPVLNLSEEDDQPSATSTLKKDQKPPTSVVGILV
ncbi:uncharacterized protein LOC121876055 isoform X2 [Homarus americanus]|uniref:uncharacterized protein LOC121876055 isoform X2 n=1 Tax=Homarus americanus TaxID=6706 RepID=UPI001C4381F9|nr:uncharacterized protein LOC121876055 isoform X2 [Homarus americanus]